MDKINYKNKEDNMKYKDCLKNYVTPYLQSNDKPYNRELFNNTINFLHQDNLITDWQAENWVYPNTKNFE